MGQKRIGIDLDGTVANFVAGILPLLKEYYGLEPSCEDIKTNRVDEILDITPEMWFPKMRKHLYKDLHLFRNLPKKEPDIELLTQLLKRKEYKVYIITGRPGDPIIRKDTKDWLDEHGFNYDDIFHVKDKGELCKLMRVHVMLEDEVPHINNLQLNKINVVVPDQPWNQHLPGDPNRFERKRGRVRRVYNWHQASDAVEGLLERVKG